MIIYYEPNGVIKIEFEQNREILPSDIPPGLTDLYFNINFNKQLKLGILPTTLKKIVFGDKYNQEIFPNTLPENLEFIQFGKEFKCKVSQYIFPVNLKNIFFMGNYKHKIHKETFPPNLKYLYFNFNKYEIEDNVLPINLEKIKLGYDYNFEFKKNTLPKKLKHLELGGIYSHILKEIPKSLKILSICGSKENELLLNNLPSTIALLILYNLEIPLLNLPTNIKYIKLICYTEETLKLLKIPFGCNVYDRYNKEIKTLP